MPPANDDFVNAIDFGSDSGSTTGSNVASTLEVGEPSPTDGSGTHSVWWKWTPSIVGNATVDLSGSSFDTTLEVFTGASVGALTLVASDDDSGTGSASLVTWFADGTTTYYLRVNGFSAGNTGSIALAWSITPPPDYDLFSDALVITGETGLEVIDNTGASLEAGELDLIIYWWWPSFVGAPLYPPIGDIGDPLYDDVSVWCEWVAPSTKDMMFYTINTEPSTWSDSTSPDTTISIWTGTSPTAVTDLTCYAYADEVYEVPGTPFLLPYRGTEDRRYLSFLSVPVTLGTTYWIRLAGYDGSEYGPITLEWAPTPTTTNLDAEVNISATGVGATPSGSVSLTVTTTCVTTIGSTVDSSAIALSIEFEDITPQATLVINLAGFVTSGPITFPFVPPVPYLTAVFNLVADVGSTFTGAASLTAQFFLQFIRTNLTATFSMTVSASTVIGGSGTGGTVISPADNVDVPFESNTGVRFASAAILSFATPIFDTKDAERDLLTVSPRMKNPLIINGRPMHPEIPIVVPSTLDILAYTTTRPNIISDPPTTGPNNGNKSPRGRWIAEGANVSGSGVSSWPNQMDSSSGGWFQDIAAYQPSQSSYSGVVDYDFVVNFWWNNVEHMRSSWSSDISEPYTFIFTVILHGGTKKQHHHILDRTNGDGITHSSSYWVTQSGGGTTYDAHFSEATERAFLHVRPNSIQQGAGSIYTGHSDLHHKAAIYTACFDGSDSYIDVHMQGHHKKIRGNVGSNNPTSQWLLGREANWLSPYHASHMSMLEIDMFHQRLSADELDHVKKHLFALYQLHKW